jgi:hypothetical protein
MADISNVKPKPKVVASTIAPAVTAVILYVLNLIWPNVDIPTTVQVAVMTIVVFFFGWVTPEKKQ